MADTRISQLTPLPVGDIDAAVDQLAVADISAAETKKASPADVVQAGIPQVADGSIPAAKLVDGSVTTAKLATSAVTTAELAPLSVTTDRVVDGAITSAKLAPDALNGLVLAADSVTSVQIANSAVNTSELADGSVTTAKLANVAVTTAKLAGDSVTNAILANNAVETAKILDAAVTGPKILDGAITTNKVSDGSITAAKLGANAATDSIANGSFPAAKLVPGSVTDTQLAVDAVTTNAIADGAVSTPKIAAGAVTSDRIALLGVTTDRIALNAVTSARIADGAVSATELATNAVETDKIIDGAVTSSKLAAASVDAAALADNSVDTGAIIDAAVTASKLATNAVTEDKIAGGAVTTTKIANLSVTQGKLALGSVGDAQITGPIGLDKLPTAGGNQFLAGPTSGAATTVAPRAIVSADLPLATDTVAGAAAFPAGGGLVINGGEVSIANTAAGAEGPYVFYTSQGLVTNSRALLSGDLPVATGAEPGAVQPGSNLEVDPSGVLSHTASGAGAQIGLTKVDVDVNGHVVGFDVLAPSDIPTLPADKISGGTLDPALIGTKTVTRDMLADYSISYIQEAEPGVPPDAHIGCLWLQESSGQLRMWNGNSFFPVGFGRLAQENLRWGGTVDATTDQVVLVTALGAAAGLTVGNSLPSATDALSGIYVVVSVGGSAISVTPGISYDAGDWVLCVDQAQGWVRIDTLTGGGGGGSDYLNDLLDVTLTTPQNGQVLAYNSALAQWVNVTSPTSPVNSVFGRTGAIVALEGDYTLGLMGDVDLTTVSPANGNVLRYNNTAGQWQPAAPQALSPTTTQGDLIQRGATVDQRLGIGAANQVLHVNATGTLAEWRALTAASTTVTGVTRLATTAETTAGTLSTVAVTPAGAKAAYLPLDLSTLPLLP